MSILTTIDFFRSDAVTSVIKEVMAEEIIMVLKLYRNCIKITQNFVDKRVLPMYNKSVCESTHRRRLVFSTQHIA